MMAPTVEGQQPGVRLAAAQQHYTNADPVSPPQRNARQLQHAIAASACAQFSFDMYRSGTLEPKWLEQRILSAKKKTCGDMAGLKKPNFLRKLISTATKTFCRKDMILY